VNSLQRDLPYLIHLDFFRSPTEKKWAMHNNIFLVLCTETLRLLLNWLRDFIWSLSSALSRLMVYALNSLHAAKAFVGNRLVRWILAKIAEEVRTIVGSHLGRRGNPLSL